MNVRRRGTVQRHTLNTHTKFTKTRVSSTFFFFAATAANKILPLQNETQKTETLCWHLLCENNKKEIGADYADTRDEKKKKKKKKKTREMRRIHCVC